MRFPFRLRSILRLLLNAVTLLLLLLAVAAVVFGVRSHRVGEEWEILGGEVRGDLALHRSTCFYSFEGVVHVIKVERDEPRKWGEQALAASLRQPATRYRRLDGDPRPERNGMRILFEAYRRDATHVRQVLSGGHHVGGWLSFGPGNHAYFWLVELPYWWIAVACGLVPGSRLGLAAARRIRARQRRRDGLCPACGYDLRATPQGCPECGKTAAP